MIIAIDFDGTCVTHEYPRVGRDIGAAEVLRELAEHHKLILFTMRDGETLQHAEDWWDQNNIPRWASNLNPEQDTWSKSRKVYAHLYIDDAALGIPLREGAEGERPHVDWVKTKELLIERGYLIHPDMKAILETP